MRVVVLHRAQTCAACHRPLASGQRVGWDESRGMTVCRRCLPPAVFADDVRAWPDTTTAERPIRGRLVDMLTARAKTRPDQVHVRPRGVGPAGEERIGAVLAAVDGVRVLHYRRMPARRGSIDHLAIGSDGVWVIDARRRAGQEIGVRDVGGPFRRDERLFVDGGDQTVLVDRMGSQVDAVRAALAGAHGHVPVHSALCFVDGEWPLRAKPLEVRGVSVCPPKALLRLLRRPGALDAPAIGAVTEVLAEVLPAA